MLDELPPLNAVIRLAGPGYYEFGKVTIVDSEEGEFYVWWDRYRDAGLRQASGPYRLDESDDMLLLRKPEVMQVTETEPEAEKVAKFAVTVVTMQNAVFGAVAKSYRETIQIRHTIRHVDEYDLNALVSGLERHGWTIESVTPETE